MVEDYRPGKVSKTNVHYRTAIKEKSCGTCAMFTKVKKGPDGGVCDLVEGVIDSGDYCDRYTGRSFEAT